MYECRVRQLDLPWAKRPAPVTSSKPKGAPYLLNTSNQTFRWHEPSLEDALERAAAVAKSRKSTTTLYEEVDGKCGPRLAAFDPKGERFL